MAEIPEDLFTQMKSQMVVPKSTRVMEKGKLEKRKPENETLGKDKFDLEIEKKKFKSKPIEYSKVKFKQLQCFDFLYSILEKNNSSSPQNIKKIIYSNFQILRSQNEMPYTRTNNPFFRQEYYFLEKGFNRDSLSIFYDLIYEKNLCLILQRFKIQPEKKYSLKFSSFEPLYELIEPESDYILFPMDLNNIQMIEINYRNKTISKKILNVDQIVNKFTEILIPKKDEKVIFIFAPIDTQCISENFYNRYVKVDKQLTLNFDQYTNEKFKKFLIFLEKFGPELNIWFWIKYNVGNKPTEKCLNQSLVIEKEETIVRRVKDECASQCGQTTNLFQYLFFGERGSYQIQSYIVTKQNVSSIVDNIMEILQTNYIEILVEADALFCGHVFSIFLFENKYYWVESYIYKYPLTIKVYDYFDFYSVLTKFVDIFKTKTWSEKNVETLKALFSSQYQEVLNKNFPEGERYWDLNLLPSHPKKNQIIVKSYPYPKNKFDPLIYFEKLLDYSSLNQEQRNRLNLEAPSDQSKQKLIKNIDDIQCAFNVLFKYDFFVDLPNFTGKINCKEARDKNIEIIRDSAFKMSF